MSESLKKTLLFYGAGNMAEGIIGGLVRKQAAPAGQILAYNRTSERLDYLHRTYGIRPVKNLEADLAAAGIIFLAVRPQDAAGVLPIIRRHGNPQALVISICAGITIARLEEALGAERRICKVMPNTLIEAGHGYSAATPNAAVNSEDRADLEIILNSIGQTMFVPENMFDPFTAFSCGGPAYLMACLNAFIDAGVHTGFSRESSRKMVLENCLGTALTLLNSDKHPYQIIDAMTSPAGVGIEAMYELGLAGLNGILMKSVKEAVRRARELGE